jgi:error-prone DNA polymerase
LNEESSVRPLQQMNISVRLVADFSGTGLTIGKHPMAYRQAALSQQHVLSSDELRYRQDGEYVKIAGLAIDRRRPGTAKGFIFISVEDENGLASIIVTPDLYERERSIVENCKFIIAEGPLQNQDGVIHVKAVRLRSMFDQTLEVHSHAFH